MDFNSDWLKWQEINYEEYIILRINSHNHGITVELWKLENWWLQYRYISNLFLIVYFQDHVSDAWMYIVLHNKLHFWKFYPNSLVGFENVSIRPWDKTCLKCKNVTVCLLNEYCVCPKLFDHTETFTFFRKWRTSVLVVNMLEKFLTTCWKGNPQITLHFTEMLLHRSMDFSTIWHSCVTQPLQ